MSKFVQNSSDSESSHVITKLTHWQIYTRNLQNTTSVNQILAYYNFCLITTGSSLNPDDVSVCSSEKEPNRPLSTRNAATGMSINETMTPTLNQTACSCGFQLDHCWKTLLRAVVCHCRRRKLTSRPRFCSKQMYGRWQQL